MTEAAATHVRKALDKRGKGLGIRLGVTTSGCSGMAYVLEFVDDIQPDEIVFESHGVKVFVDPKSMVYLDGTELDFVREGLNEGFNFAIPMSRPSAAAGRVSPSDRSVFPGMQPDLARIISSCLTCPSLSISMSPILVHVTAICSAVSIPTAMPQHPSLSSASRYSSALVNEAYHTLKTGRARALPAWYAGDDTGEDTDTAMDRPSSWRRWSCAKAWLKRETLSTGRAPGELASSGGRRV